MRTPGTPRRRQLLAAAYGAVNVVAALVLLILVAPILLSVALIIRLDDGGPVLFRQQRIGRFGVPFTIYKFRTMKVGAEAELAALIAATGGEISAFVKLAKDPRVTRVGRFLRASSVDELPQLVNVLRREMNLVGPRPQVTAEVETYDDVQWRRLLVLPGLTGLWQVSGRSELSSTDSLRLDDIYVRRQTAWMDLTILARTAWVVLGRRGAY